MSLPLAAAATRLLLDPLLSVVFPSSCPACQSTLDAPLGGPLCAACWQSLPVHQGALCRCGELIAASVGPVCGRCRRGLTLFASGASLGPYAGALRLLVHALKFHGRRRVAERLAERLVAERRVADMLRGDALVVPVPLHAARLRERGFNQSALLAAALAERSQAALATRALVRRRATAPQVGLSAAARRRNVSGAFSVARPRDLAGRRVVLVDDVWTTGATLNACARQVLAAGAREASALTVARVT